ncbi:unnamed protein product [Rotaria magnacalcarata]|uniref:Uncharacterized protein n=1 Tax=Rotaria magnacalcarata TaxID=392030 RepID=A0A816Z263_9BILA|nr:unnamed protein product [Rotaria magnacalcarata]
MDGIGYLLFFYHFYIIYYSSIIFTLFIILVNSTKFETIKVATNTNPSQLVLEESPGIIKDCVVVYERKMMLQAGALIDGVNLHLSKLTRKSRRRHRIAAPAEDGQHISFKSITSITLD